MAATAGLATEASALGLIPVTTALFTGRPHVMYLTASNLPSCSMPLLSHRACPPAYVSCGRQAQVPRSHVHAGPAGVLLSAESLAISIAGATVSPLYGAEPPSYLLHCPVTANQNWSAVCLPQDAMAATWSGHTRLG